MLLQTNSSIGFDSGVGSVAQEKPTVEKHSAILDKAAVVLALIQSLDHETFLDRRSSSRHENDFVSGFHHAILAELKHGFLHQFFRLFQGIYQNGMHAQHETRRLAGDGDAGRQNERRHAGTELADVSGHFPGIAQNDNEFGIDVNDGRDGTRGDTLSSSQLSSFGHDRVSDGLIQRVVISGLFGIDDRSAHNVDGLFKVGTVGRFSRQHDSIGSVINSIGHVGTFGTSGTWVVDHALEHLCGGNDGLAGNVGLADHKLLGQKDLGGRDLHTELCFEEWKGPI